MHLKIYNSIIGIKHIERPSWSWSYGSWIYNYLFNQCLSPITLCVQIPPRRGVLDMTVCDKVRRWHATARRFPPGTPASSSKKTGRHDITEIVWTVPSNIINLTCIQLTIVSYCFKNSFSIKISAVYQSLLIYIKSTLLWTFVIY